MTSTLPESCFFECSVDAFVRFSRPRSFTIQRRFRMHSCWSTFGKSMWDAQRSREIPGDFAATDFSWRKVVSTGNDVAFSGTFGLVKKINPINFTQSTHGTGDRKRISAQIFPFNFRNPWCWWQSRQDMKAGLIAVLNKIVCFELRNEESKGRSRANDAHDKIRCPQLKRRAYAFSTV